MRIFGFLDFNFKCLDFKILVNCVVFFNIFGKLIFCFSWIDWGNLGVMSVDIIIDIEDS